MKRREFLSALALSGTLILTFGACRGVREPKPEGPYRNLALNSSDTRGEARTYPHATSNSECRGELCFAALNVINGGTDNLGHGKKFPSWGPDKREDLWLKIEFGRPVVADRIDLFIRADFPHDRHWHSAVVEFSDGGREKIAIRKTAERQTFAFPERKIEWLRFTDLVQEEPLGWCGFTEVEVWGRELAR